MLTAREEIHIGAGVEFGPNVLIYDHDHDFRAKGGLKAKKFKSGKVHIGDNAWIGANTVILKNTTIGNNCVIGAGCVLANCNIPDNTVVVQRRDTEIISYQLNR
ncbi:MAG: acyltransferase [Paludibacteraceae bacterium]|nr:acyltransferase [Paludibacteraceae bacterium]